MVESSLYVEVTLVLGTGILGLGHHYFWIGTPRYWFAIGGFFSALEPLPLLEMVVHAVYDAGERHLQADNRPAFYWTLAGAFSNLSALESPAELVECLHIDILGIAAGTNEQSIEPRVIAFEKAADCR